MGAKIGYIVARTDADRPSPLFGLLATGIAARLRSAIATGGAKSVCGQPS